MKNKYFYLLVLFLTIGLFSSCKPSKPKSIPKPKMDLEEALERRDEEAVAYWAHEMRHNTTLRYEHGVTPLMLAAKTGNVNIMKLALNTDWDVNSTDNAKNTPLHWAVMYKKYEAAQMLIDAGAEVDADKAWKTPLGYAIRNHDIEMIKLLIRNGADVNKKEEIDALTPLMWAGIWAFNTKGEMHKILLDAGAKAEIQDETGETALTYAVREFCPECVKLLIEAGADVNNKFVEGKIPLLLAGETCNAESAKILMDAGADASVRDEYGATPFILSARNFCTDEDDIRIYSESKVDITAKDNFGRTALDYVEQNPHVVDKDIEFLKQEISKRKDNQRNN